MRHKFLVLSSNVLLNLHNFASVPCFYDSSIKSSIALSNMYVEHWLNSKKYI